MTLKKQRLAQAAYERVSQRKKEAETYRKEYRSFAREFPTLVHQCGLAQAVAFAQANANDRTKKKHYEDYGNDLAAVLKAAGHEEIADLSALAEKTRSLPMTAYVRLSRDALDAAVWLKRYVEALFEVKKREDRTCETTSSSS